MSLFRIAVPAIIALGVNTAQAASFDHSAWDRLLREHVNTIGEVDYAKLKADPRALNAYVETLGAASPKSSPAQFPTTNHEVAYWINAYNAFMIHAVVAKYPIGGVNDLGMFRAVFRRVEHNAGGEIVSLGHIEHELLRKVYAEPRIHFALVCASVSCPTLAAEAMRGETLDAQLNALAEQFVSQSRNVTIDPANKRVTMSKIFDWYLEDFEAPTEQKGNAALLTYIRRYLDPSRAAALEKLGVKPRVRFHNYDWGLNEPGSRARSKNSLERDFARSLLSASPSSPPGS